MATKGLHCCDNLGNNSGSRGEKEEEKGRTPIPPELYRGK